MILETIQAILTPTGLIYILGGAVLGRTFRCNTRLKRRYDNNTASAYFV